MSTFAFGQLQSGVVTPLTPCGLAEDRAGRCRGRAGAAPGGPDHESGRNAIRIHRYVALSAFCHATAMDTAVIAATLKARICPVRACSWF